MSEAETGGLPREARQWAMISHLIALVGLLGNGIGFVLGPLVVWLIKREDHPFVDEQGKESLNFQITMMIAMLLCIPLCFVLIGLFLLPIIILTTVILPIVAAIKTNKGEHYRYPFAWRIVK